MNIMLIAIAAVVIIGIILAVVMMKKKGDAPTTTTPVIPKAGNRPKTLAEQQQERELQTQAPQPTPTVSAPVDSLLTAQTLVDKKDYATAITTLKSAITAEPQRSDLQLLLLNIYAQQNNHSDFYSQYENLMHLNDPSAHAQASKLKALIDEEHAFQANKTMPSTAPLAVAAVATTAAVMATTSHAEPAPVADSIDFDSLEMDSFQNATPTAVTEKATTTENTDDDLAFDFDLDNDTTSTPNGTSPTHSEAFASSEPAKSVDTTVPAEEDDFAFDLSDEIATTSHTSPAVADTPITTVETASPPAEEESFDFEDFNLELPATSPVETHVTPAPTVVETPAQPVAVETNTTVADDDFDFDLSFDEPKTTTTVYAPTATAEPLLSTELTPALVTEDTHPASVAHDVSAEAEKTVALDDDFNFDLEDLSPATPSQPAVNTETVTPSTTEPLASEMAFDLPDDKAEDTISDLSTSETSAPVSPSVADIAPALLVTAPVLAGAVSHAMPTDSSPIVATTPVPLAEQQDFSPAFEVVKGLDNHQVTLELAEQYIQLGEYDSAKRLLNEVHTASPAHQQTASQLLASID